MIFVMAKCGLFEVRTEFLNITSKGFKGLRSQLF
jgi:hypothetical protein